MVGGFVLDTDASDKAIGAVLSQVQDGKERVVAYGSFVLSTTQIKKICVRMQDKWGKFEEEVDDVVPLAVREVGIEPGGWLENYTKEELRKVQLEDEIVWKVLRWLELGGE